MAYVFKGTLVFMLEVRSTFGECGENRIDCNFYQVKSNFRHFHLQKKLYNKDNNEKPEKGERFDENPRCFTASSPYDYKTARAFCTGEAPLAKRTLGCTVKWRKAVLCLQCR